MKRPKPKRGFTIIDLLAVIGCIAILLALTAPAISQARAAARRSMCKNNLKQIGLALHNYHDVHNTFPPGWIAASPAPGARIGYGWQTFILPQVEQNPLFNRIDFNKPLASANGLMQTELPVYRCPEDATPNTNPLRSNYGTSNYSGNYGTIAGRWFGAPNGRPLTGWLAPRRTQNWPGAMGQGHATDGVFYRNSTTRMRDIVDGTSNSFMVGERSAKSGAGIWPGAVDNATPNDVVTDCSAGNTINSRYTSFSSEHKGGAQFAICDGSVRFISENINQRTFSLLGSINDGQPIGDF